MALRRDICLNSVRRPDPLGDRPIATSPVQPGTAARPTGWIVTLAGLLCIVSACATAKHPDAVWEDRALDAQQLHDAGEFDEAERRYEKLLEEADSPGDTTFMELKLARLAADRGNYERAFERYEAIGREGKHEAHAARGYYKAADLAETRLERPDDSDRLRRLVVTEYPETSWAELAVEDIAATYVEQQAWDEMRRAFRRLHDEVPGTAAAENILFELAQRLHYDAGRPDAALALYRELARRYPDSTLAADVEWAAAEIFQARQQWDAAVAWLERTAERVEPSNFFGELSSPYASRARYRLGYIHLVFLHDYPGARRHFRRFLDDFPTDRLADDATWHLAQTYRLEQNWEAYEDQLRAFVDTYPDSRYVERARRQLDEVTGDR